MTDRITGLLLLMLAVAYGILGSGFESDFITDPLGPTAFPIMLAILLALFSLNLLLRPDPEPDWHGAAVWRRQIFALAALIIYALVLEYFGFILSSTVLVAYLAWLMGADLRHTATTGIGATILLYFLFNNFLGLPLPTGEIFGG